MALALVLVGLAVGQLPGTPPEVSHDEAQLALEDEVAWLTRHPLDINSSTPGDLLQIPWLDPRLAVRIVEYRDSIGGFSRLEDLERVEGLTQEWLRLLVPLLCVGMPKTNLDWYGGILARGRTDTLPTTSTRLAAFGRATIERDQWQATGVWEKDRFEPDPADLVKLGLSWSGDNVRIIAGDFIFGTGLGLVFAGPHRQAGEWLDAGLRGPDRLRLLRSAYEGRSQRGVGTELAGSGWRAGAFGSRTGRDARLNSDGTVAKLVAGGLHDDSASIAGRAAVDEAVVGLSAGFGRGQLGAGIAWCFVDYDREFVPEDSGSSFAGRRLWSGGMSVEFRSRSYRTAAEFAGSSGGGIAGALDLSGRWRGLDVGVGLTGYGARYFAPLSRSRALTEREPQLGARGRLGYRLSGFEVDLRGNTRRDLAVDSLPARVEGEARYRAGGFGAEVAVGRSYRLEAERHRTLRVEVGYRSRRATAGVRVAEEYSETGGGRGWMCALIGRGETGWLRLSSAAAWFDVQGKGVRLYLRDPAPVGLARTFSTAEPAWRVVAGVGAEVGAGWAVDVVGGVTWRSGPRGELGAQVEWTAR